MNRPFGLISAFLMALAVVATSNAAIVNFEQSPDAGELLPDAQLVDPDVLSIIGTLGDRDVDMFKIVIGDPANFSATTVGLTTANPPSPFLDTWLFLFDSSGHLVAENDDFSAEIKQSFIPPGSVSAPGTYYLAISEFPVMPDNLFMPNDPITLWDKPPPDFGPIHGGDYTIALFTTPTVVPEPSSFAAMSILLSVAAVTMARRRRPQSVRA